MIHIKPRAGLRVPDPATGQPLPEDGARVADTSYWRRRIADGDAEIIKAQAEKPRRSQKTTEEGND